MTVFPRLASSSRALAKALHPSGSATGDVEGSGARPGRRLTARPSAPDPGLLAVLQDEDTCRSWLDSSTVGWIAYGDSTVRAPVAVAAVEGSEVLLVASSRTANLHLPVGRTGTLDVSGETEGPGHWVVHATGPVQTVIAPDPPRAGRRDDRSWAGSSPLDDSEFTVLCLTVESIRGFASSR